MPAAQIPTRNRIVVLEIDWIIVVLFKKITTLSAIH